MRIVAVCLLLVGSVLANIHDGPDGCQFDRDSLRPTTFSDEDVKQTGQIGRWKISKADENAFRFDGKFTEGQQLNVEFISDVPMKDFLLVAQVSHPTTHTPIGVWTDGNSASICGGGDGMTHFTFTWVAPQSTPVNSIEFVISLLNNSGSFWIINSAVITKAENDHGASSEDSQEEQDEKLQESIDEEENERKNDHGADLEDEMMREQNQRKAEADMQEDRNDWEGDWEKRKQEEEDAHEKQIHDEIFEYEKMSQLREKERLEMIRMELMDAENWNKEHRPTRKPAVKPTVPVVVDGNAGSSAATFGVLTLLLAFFLTRLF